MNTRATLVLLIVTLLVVGGVIALRFSVPGTREAGIVNLHALDFDPAQIDRIEIERGGETVILRREGFEWQIKAPVQDTASPGAVERLLQTARFLQVRDRRDAGDKDALAEAGLLEPKLRLRLQGRGERRLDLGGEAPFKGSMYARAGGAGPILLVPDDLRALCLQPVENFRDRQLTGLVPDDIQEIVIVRDDGELALRRAGGRWMIDKPIQAPADAQEIAQFLAPLLSLRIEKFGSGTAPDAAPLPGQSAKLLLTPRARGDEAVELQVFRPADPAAVLVPARFAPRGGAIEVDFEALRLFDVMPEDFRDRRLGHVQLDTVDRIALAAGGRAVTLVREGAGWKALETGRGLPMADIEAFTRAFNDTRVLSFPAAGAAEHGIDPPAASVRFEAWLSENTAEEAAGGHAMAGLDVGADAGEGAVYARIPGASQMLVVPRAFTDQITARVRRAFGEEAAAEAPSASIPGAE